MIGSGLRFAAIDIGSNAIRLLFTRVIEGNGNSEPFFIKESLIRMPLRLGQDVFNNGSISKNNSKSFINTISGFKYLLDAYQPINYRACATAAMRNAKNNVDLIRKVKNHSGVNIEIISGSEEASLILGKNINQYLKQNKTYLHIDVGGGSTELSIISNGIKRFSKSFSIGSVRLLEKKVKKAQWEEMYKWLTNHTKSIGKIKAIGSGGNINKISSMLGVNKGEMIKLDSIKNIIKEINNKTINERITLLGLRPDRADVITYASKIYISCMEWSGAKKIIVPQSGLADGIVNQLYKKYINGINVS